MPHLDEGQLHALLDGAYALDSPETVRIRAHLAECAQCRAQLEQENALRERAAVILRTARPGSEEMPPFTQVLQRAQRTPRRVRLPAPTRLAWAASIMLALGAGWISRGVFPGSAAFDRVAQVSTPVPAPVANSADRRAESEVIETPAAPAAGTSQSGQGVARDGARGSRVADRAAAPPPATTRPVEERAEVFAQKAVPPAASPIRADSVTRAVPTAPPPTMAAQSRSQRAAEGAAAPQAQAAAALQSQAAGVVGLAYGGQLTWTYPPQAEAERIARRSVLLVPGLEVVSIGVASRAGAWLFRATQRLPDGNTIELLQEPDLELNRARSNFAERDAARSQTLTEEAYRLDETGASLLTVRKGEVRVTARATLPSDSLRVLLRRLR